MTAALAFPDDIDLTAACSNDEQKRLLARRYGISASQVEDICRRVGTSRGALEAAVAMLKFAG